MKRKHFKFDSKHLTDFVVVDERRDNISLYPHTQQLAKLHVALYKEFRAPLSQIIARVNRYSDDFKKIVRYYSAHAFCQFINSGRSDRLRLHCLLDPDKVAQVTIVQQITEHNKLGGSHQFRFYGGADFFPEIRLSGKRLVFSNHVLKRFNQRAHNLLTEELSAFLDIFFRSSVIGMTINDGQALVLPNMDEFLAFTYEETDSETFLTTCLDQSMVYDLRGSLPIRSFNLHYGEAYTQPKIRNWNPWAETIKYQTQWQRKKLIQPREVLPFKKDWPAKSKRIQPLVRSMGHNENSKLCFYDDIPGPGVFQLLPGYSMPRFEDPEFIVIHVKEGVQEKAADQGALVKSNAEACSKQNVIEVAERVKDQKNPQPK
jgi:hypothetical protein